MAILVVIALFASQKLTLSGLGLLLILIPVGVIIGINILKIKIGFSPMFKRSDESSDKLFVIAQGLGFLGISLFLIRNSLIGLGIALIGVISIFIIERKSF